MHLLGVIVCEGKVKGEFMPDKFRMSQLGAPKPERMLSLVIGTLTLMGVSRFDFITLNCSINDEMLRVRRHTW